MASMLKRRSKLANFFNLKSNSETIRNDAGREEDEVKEETKATTKNHPSTSSPQSIRYPPNSDLREQKSTFRGDYSDGIEVERYEAISDESIDASGNFEESFNRRFSNFPPIPKTKLFSFAPNHSDPNETAIFNLPDISNIENVNGEFQEHWDEMEIDEVKPGPLRRNEAFLELPSAVSDEKISQMVEEFHQNQNLYETQSNNESQPVEVASQHGPLKVCSSLNGKFCFCAESECIICKAAQTAIDPRYKNWRELVERAALGYKTEYSPSSDGMGCGRWRVVARSDKEVREALKEYEEERSALRLEERIKAESTERLKLILLRLPLDGVVVPDDVNLNSRIDIEDFAF